MKKNIFKKINNNKKKRKVIIFLSIGFSTLTILPISIIPILNAQNNVQNVLNPNLAIKNVNQDADKFSQNYIDPIPIDFIYRNQLITSNEGPIVSWQDTIYSLDWFGKTRWEIDISKLTTDITDYSQWWHRKWSNWALDRKTNTLYVMGLALRNQKQDLIVIDVASGKVKKQFKINRNLGSDTGVDGTAVGLESTSLSILNSGKILSFGSAKFTSAIIDLNDDSTITRANLTSWNTLLKNQPNYDSTGGDNDRPVPEFIIPIGQNINIAAIKSLKYNSTIFALVDDNIQPIYNNQSDYWSLSKKVIDNGTQNPSFRLANGQFYKFLNNKVVFFIQDRMFLFDATKIGPNSSGFISYKFNKPISSWSVDTNENIFFKFDKDGKIYKISNVKDIQVPNQTTSEKTSQELSLETYYDLSGSSIEVIRKNSNLFQIYSVHGYAGSLMLLSGINSATPIINPDTVDKTNLGIAMGIVSNVNSPNQGDSPGLLNTKAAFQYAADFDISQTILQNKLPSEISQRDLELLNNSFFTTNTTIDANGNLVYDPFVKKNINDQNGTFQIDVNLDQIPWFTTQLPQNFTPTKISKVFNTITKIPSRVQWKSVDVDYNFKNTLPSKVTTDDLNNFDPFLIDLVSQRILDSNNNQIYPKKTYSISNANDSTGIITVQCVYDYMPIGVPALDSNALSYTITNDFQIFKKDGSQSFNWIGGNGTSDIKNIPSLKELSENNLLPSSIDGSNSNFFLKFIDLNTTKGYPLNKMTFSVSPNDTTGIISIQATLPKDYYNNQSDEVFTKNYNGFNKTSNYSFVYQIPTNLNIIGSSNPSIENTNPSNDYKKMLPSNITEEMIYDDFIQYTGYNSLDLELSLTPNNNNGSLKIQFILSNNYPEILGTTNSFNKIGSDYVSSITLGGFLTFADYQNQYVVSFKNNNDTSLTSLKSLELTTIFDKLKKPEGLVVNGITYKSEVQLANLFISSYGISLPVLKESNVNFYSDSLSGELTLEIQLLIAETGLANNLIFNSVFTGFRQGVTTPTNDSFVFKNNDSLDNNLLNKLPSEIKSEIESNSSLLKTYFVGFVSGQFITLIDDPNSYTLTIDVNDLYGTISIEIEFTKLTDPQTLKTYAKNYSGFLKSFL